MFNSVLCSIIPRISLLIAPNNHTLCKEQTSLKRRKALAILHLLNGVLIVKFMSGGNI